MTHPDPSDFPEPPVGLSPEAETLWRGWHEDIAEANDDPGVIALPDARELAVLTEACRHLTLASRLEEALAETADLMVPGSRGNVRVTPIVGEIDKVRRTVSTLLASIRPPVDRSKINAENVATRYRPRPRRQDRER